MLHCTAAHTRCTKIIILRHSVQLCASAKWLDFNFQLWFFFLFFCFSCVNYDVSMCDVWCVHCLVKLIFVYTSVAVDVIPYILYMCNVHCMLPESVSRHSHNYLMGLRSTPFLLIVSNISMSMVLGLAVVYNAACLLFRKYNIEIITAFNP